MLCYEYDATTIEQISKDIVTRISTTLGELGHKIKIEEPYGSKTYFAFSEAASIGTIELPQTSRKIRKVYGVINAFVATLDEHTGSTFSNAHSACKVST